MTRLDRVGHIFQTLNGEKKLLRLKPFWLKCIGSKLLGLPSSWSCLFMSMGDDPNGDLQMGGDDERVDDNSPLHAANACECPA